MALCPPSCQVSRSPRCRCPCQGLFHGVYQSSTSSIRIAPALVRRSPPDVDVVSPSSVIPISVVFRYSPARCSLALFRKKQLTSKSPSIYNLSGKRNRASFGWRAGLYGGILESGLWYSLTQRRSLWPESSPRSGASSGDPSLVLPILLTSFIRSSPGLGPLPSNPTPTTRPSSAAP